MRDKLLQVLEDTADAYVSGQQISRKLGISRTAVWKHIEELRKNGYEIEAAPRKGYRLTHTPNRVSADEIKARLHTNTFGQRLFYKEEVTSTQEEAHELAGKHEPEGTVVAADKQVKGKGRLDRPWLSTPGTGLWFSIILRPDIRPQYAPQLTLLAAVAVTEGISSATGLDPCIKWPNDILLNGKKTAGILTEMQSDPDRVQAVIIGIGLNINHETDDFPPDLQSKATSLALENNGAAFHRADITASVLKSMEQWYETYLTEGFASIRRRWEELAVTIGTRVRAVSRSKTVEGYAEGITEDGVLLLKQSDGTIEKIYSADID
ncbi:biotin--[acetyl-CoA-carboxylase] ligase [Salibacterium halotolerans]|uniref:Bifunctional ligase/repressor BirA n=1 Tax=Salibacterium halotolerans TaxID=1884432 RepID=A0A1I5Q9G0_9BACI|nr:biotin--[acetyl-CoA-carboxylase] ligase [Salibacterium halotolerans]SFP42661.1 BirA family transcriptional regulator, biotin operon repressor / biotin-[acetyl-CoA-carboxylase] ligase [Salibacterium halotolerans]